MTLAEILGQVVLPSLAAMGAGIGGGLVYAQRKGNGNGHRLPPTSGASLPPPPKKRSEQLAQAGECASTAQRDLAAFRCDRHQALEDAIAAAHVEAREFRAEVKAELRHLREDVANVHAVTSELRDAALRAEAEPRRYPVGIVRGGAAVPR